MPPKTHIMLVVGARPNFMKAAPLLHALRREAQFRYTLVHTGQHYDVALSEQFFRELQIPDPDVNLEVGSGSHAEQTAAIMRAFEGVVMKDPPDWVCVFGDVNSTVACALVSAKLGIRIAHVEAGLRSYDRSMPEEINRIVTDAIADVLFTPSADAAENLKREGVDKDRIINVGNIMIDTLMQQRDEQRAQTILQSHRLHAQEFVYVTLHRPSNVDHREQLEKIVQYLDVISRELPVIFPVHPRTKKKLDTFALALPSRSTFHQVDPVGYLTSIAFAEHARFVLTDSGGLQEETTVFHTPCLTLRPNTERPVTISEGSNKLTDLTKLLSDVQAILGGPLRIGKVPDGWDGKASERIVRAFLTRTIPSHVRVPV
jgi:UDP-N-acetylglucosamine 2-epimerase (non-hydrolysing)